MKYAGATSGGDVQYRDILDADGDQSSDTIGSQMMITKFLDVLESPNGVDLPLQKWG